MKPKKIAFDYFRVMSCRKNENGEPIETLLDLTALFTRAQEINYKDRTYPYKDDKARIQHIRFHNDVNAWEIQLLRLRETSLPGLADEDGGFEIIQLEDGKYVGESTSLLYDSSNCVLVMQRNVNGLPPSGIEEYLNKCTNNTQHVTLRPIVPGNVIEKITREKIYRKLVIGIDAGDIDTITGPASLNTILRNFLNYQGVSYKFEVTMGNVKKDRTIAPGLVVDTINELYGNIDANALKVDYRDTYDSQLEKVDLLNDRRRDFVEVNVSRDNPLKHEDIYQFMKIKYLGRKERATIF